MNKWASSLIALSFLGFGITLKQVSADIGWWLFAIAMFAALIIIAIESRRYVKTVIGMAIATAIVMVVSALR